MQKLILLDIDGTLLTAPSEANAPASKIMFQKVFGINAHEELVDNVGRTEKEIIALVLQKVLGKEKSAPLVITDTAYQVWTQASIETLKKKPAKILPAVFDLLDGFISHNILFGILTGNSYWRAEAKLASAGLDSYFRNEKNEILGAFGNMTSRREELIEIAKERMGLQDTKAILIDDSIYVAKMIQRLDIPAVMVATGNASIEELKHYVPHVLPSFANGGWKEVIRIIEEDY